MYYFWYNLGMDISEEAIQCIKKSKKQIFEQFASDKIYRPFDVPVTFFMAGSPGAGKTEYSKNFIKNINQIIFEKENTDFPIVRIDADEFRTLCPGYNGNNSHLFQKATALAVNKLYDYALAKKYNILMDGTFSSDKYPEENIKRALNRGREVVIIYIYQDPIIAWDFTLKREKLEGRKITLEVFIDDFFKAKENVIKIKELYKNKVNIVLIKKDYNNAIEKIWLNVESIDNYVEFEYTKKSLHDRLKDIKLKI